MYTATASEEAGMDRSAAAPKPGGATSDIAAEPVDDIAPPEQGPLRAGSVDDNADFAGFLEYLERIRSIGIVLRDFDPTGRIVVNVTGTSGLPVAGAEVVVSTDGAEVARIRTTADGTATVPPVGVRGSGRDQLRLQPRLADGHRRAGWHCRPRLRCRRRRDRTGCGRRDVPPRRDRFDG